MSKTDKDRPAWVKNAEHGFIDHDHSTGECIISDDQRDRWPSWRSHRRRCAKYVTTEFTCTKDEPYRGRGGYFWRRGWDQQTCWIRVRDCKCPIPEVWKREDHGCTGRFISLGCIGHSKTVWDDSVPCHCDDRPRRATCYPDWLYDRYTSGGVPSEFIRTYYHKPERARERKLNDMRREYNAYGELEDGDFHNRQARNSARWLYW